MYANWFASSLLLFFTRVFVFIQFHAVLFMLGFAHFGFSFFHCRHYKMCNAHHDVYKWYVVATKSVGWRYDTSDDFPDSVRTVGIQLCYGHYMWTRLLAAQMGAQSK